MMIIETRVFRSATTRIIVAALAAGAIAAASIAAPDRSGPTPLTADATNPSPNAVTVIEGRARLVDGDTFDLVGRRIRLEGIDAPERSQSCARGPIGKRLAAGQLANDTLGALIANRPVRCQLHRKDGYGRDIATCWAGSTNLNREMVQRGAAWAFLKYSRTYAAEEAAARDLGVGVWAAHCTRAALYRAERWNKNAQTAPRGCPIKGNISRLGRVYHMPWNAWYERTAIDEHRGERWFCSEAEALKAGWRPATGSRPVEW